MDSSDKRINFENMPRILAELRDSIYELSDLMKGKNAEKRLSEWMGVEELRDYLPGHPARCTIYDWTRNNRIPHYKNGKLLYFYRTEIDAWLRQRGGRK